MKSNSKKFIKFDCFDNTLHSIIKWYVLHKIKIKIWFHRFVKLPRGLSMCVCKRYLYGRIEWLFLQHRLNWVECWCEIYTVETNKNMFSCLFIRSFISGEMLIFNYGWHSHVCFFAVSSVWAVFIHLSSPEEEFQCNQSARNDCDTFDWNLCVGFSLILSPYFRFFFLLFENQC